MFLREALIMRNTHSVCTQHVQLNSRTWHQWTAATSSCLPSWNGQQLDSTVDCCTKMLTLSSSITFRNRLPSSHGLHPSAVRTFVHDYSRYFPFIFYRATFCQRQQKKTWPNASTWIPPGCWMNHGSKSRRRSA